MAYKTVNVASTASFTDGETMTMLGKNGFSSTIGSIPVLCAGYSISPDPPTIVFTVKGLKHLYDLNHEEHILAVNDGQLNTNLVETTPQALYARPDLSRFYVLGDTEDTIFQYYLDVPGDISTARLLKNPIEVSDKETFPISLVFSTNGRFLYVIGPNQDSIHQYTLSIPWELSTAKFTQSKSIASQTTNPTGLSFKYNGLSLYVSSDLDIFRYDLTNSWDLSSASYVSSNTLYRPLTASSAANAQNQSNTSIKSFYIKPTGDYLFAVNGGISQPNSVYEYKMSESWNVLTAAHTGNSLTINNKENRPYGIFLDSSGLKLFITGHQGDDVNEYTLSTSWNVATASHTRDSLKLTGNASGLYFSSDGAYLYNSSNSSTTGFIRQYRLPTPWNTTNGHLANANLNILSLTGEGQGKGLYVQENGGNVYVTGALTDTVYQLRLGDTYNFANITSITSYNISAKETEPQGVFFKPDGSKMYIVGRANVINNAVGNTIYEFNLATPWSVTSASFYDFKNIIEGVNPGATDLHIKDDGTILTLVGTTDNQIYTYRFADDTPWSISSLNFTGAQKATDGLFGESDPTGIFVDSTGSRLYITGTSTDKIYQGHMTDTWAVNTLKYGISSFNGAKGRDYVSVPLNISTSKILGQVGYLDSLDEISAEIQSYSLSDVSGTVTITNQTTGGVLLSSKLPTAPFLLKFPQSVDRRYFDAKSLYIEGTRKQIQKTYDVSGISGSHSANLGIIPLGVTFIKAYLDNQDVTGSISWTSGYSITLPISSEHKQLKTIVDYYTVPAIEPGDTVTIYDDIRFKVLNVSYLHTDASYNTYLTSNSVYRITLDKYIDTRVRSGNQIINITPDTVGSVGNINSTSNTITMDYDETKYPQTYSLANYKIYTLTTGSSDFNRISLGADKTIKNINPGFYTFKARNINSFNRRSDFSGVTVEVKPIPIGKVTDLTLTESYFIDTGQAASIRVVVSFTPITAQNVTDYEISFRLESSQSVDLTSYNTVKVSAAGVESDGKIRYVINNVDRGTSSNQNTIRVRVTPLNGDKRGIESELAQALVGKTAKPKNIINFGARQFQDSLFFSYKIPTVKDITGGTDDVNPYDLDLNYIDIRKMPGSQTSPTASDWNILSTEIIRAPTPGTGAQAPITSFGTFTFLAKTIDTSGNETDDADIVYAVLQIVEPTDVSIANTYDESNAASNSITSVYNTNYMEYYWPSFSNSTNGGLSVPGAGSADNANGTTSGWSQGGDAYVNTIFTTGSTANYQTQVRSLSSALTGTVKVNYDYITVFTGDYNSFKENLKTGISVSSVSASKNNFTSTGLGSYFVGATYDTANKTLSNGGSTGNVFAIWNSNAHIGNSNSYALIANVTGDIIYLGATYYANGQPTGSNSFGNLISGSTSFDLVNLRQYSDDSTLTYQGNPGAISTKLYYRSSPQSSAFHANNNLISENFTAFSEVSGGVISREQFKHLQLRLDLTNSEPSTTTAQLTAFNYYIQLTKRNYQATITMDSNPKIIDYSSVGFTVVPEITGIIPINTGYATAPEIITANTIAANVRVYKLSDSSLPTGIKVTFKADGA